MANPRLFRRYDRTPPCSMAAVTQCSQHFHEVKIGNLTAGTTYFYQIPAANGTTASEVMSFTTAQAAGDSKQFSAVLLNDMGYANAAGTRKQIQKVSSLRCHDKLSENIMNSTSHFLAFKHFYMNCSTLRFK